jgi:hypothetical protein
MGLQEALNPQVLLQILMFAVVCVVIWLAGVGGIASAIAKYSADRKDRTSIWYTFPKWIQPNDAWHKWVGYPDQYSNVMGYYPITTTATKASTTKTNVSDPKKCMLECAGESDCVGFLMNTKSNTCSLYSSLGDLFPVASSNVVYSKRDKIPDSMYVRNELKAPAAETPVAVTSAFLYNKSDLRIKSITGAASVITVETFEPHGIDTTMPLSVYKTGVTFSSAQGSTSYYPVPVAARTVPSDTTFTFTPSSYVGTTATTLDNVSGAAGFISKGTTPLTDATDIQFTTSVDHSFEVGQSVKITGLTAGVSATFNNTFVINTVIDARNFVCTLPKGNTLGLTTTAGSAAGSALRVSGLVSFRLATNGNAQTCASVCSSNSACVAFTFTSSDRTCAQLTNAPSDLITGTGDTYTKDKPTFSISVQYW